jgi:hypothetical protein
VNLTPRSRIASPPLRRAALLASLALAFGPSSAAAQDPGALVDAAIPHESAISEQYQRVQEVLDQAAAAVPDAPLAPPAAESAPALQPEPPAPPAAPEPAPKADQYHSENVTVTQQQPSNVNVSIRINSPGDDGPVVQTNNAGGSVAVEQTEQVAERPPAVPEPALPAGGHPPDTWEWVWTSACFGGAPRAGAATAASGWSWRWSCDEEAGGDENLMSGLGAVPDGVVPDVGELIAAAAPTLAAAPLTAATAPAPPRARPDQRRDRLRRSSAGGAGPPPAGGGGAPRAGSPPVLAHAPPAAAVRPHRAARAEARARPGDGSASNLPPGGEGPMLGGSSALGGVASLLLGIWIAVLVTACVIVLPRLRHRRWTGPARRLTRLYSSRLERPG